MKILACGAGRITDELLKRVGTNWEIILIEKEEARLAPFANRFPCIVRVVAADASSPVVLDEAGLSEQDCVLAMTNADKVNLAIASFAREAGVKNVLAVVRDPELLFDFQRLDVWTISTATDAARKVYQFLKDPRIRIVDLGEGEGELLELTVSEHDQCRLGDIPSKQGQQWRLAGALRDKKLLFPEQIHAVEIGDRLLFLGKSELYNRLSGRLAQDQPHFPRTYGQQLVLAVEGEHADTTELLNEAFYVAQGTHIEQIKAVHAREAANIPQTLSRWSESLQIEALAEAENIRARTVSVALENDTGLVVYPYAKQSFLRGLFGKDFMGLAKQLCCPLLLAKFTDPYERLLVPFNGSLAGQRALEIALDLSRQLDAEVGVAIVIEPAYLHGEPSSGDKWEENILKQVRELSHVHKIKVVEHVRHGNPVKETLALVADYQLLVIGLGGEESGFFSVDVAGMLGDKAPCSVLLIPERVRA